VTATRLFACALLLALARTALSTALLSGLAAALGVAVVEVNAALLFLATSILGAAWAVRRRLRAPTSSPSVAAAVVPPIACALFVAPRLAVGPAEPSLVALSASLFFAPMEERAWSRWLVPEQAGSIPTRAALACTAPLLAVALAAGAWGSSIALGAGVLVACALGALVFVHERRRTRETRAFVQWVRSLDANADIARLPNEPPLRDARLRRTAAALRARLAELALEAEGDARARAQLADARELRTRLMAAMSHELKSPLNSIVGFSQLLEGGLDGTLTPGQRESLAVIRDAAEDLLLLLTDILDLARLEAGKLVLHRTWTPSVEILTEAVTLGRTIVEGQDVLIDAELQPGLPPVYVDKRRIVQAVVALFRQAVPSLRKTTIRLRARIADGPPGPARHLRVEIHDALGAMPRESVERIFEAFQEISAPEARRVGGLGMALALARGLVRMHGGEVWAEVPPGAGTLLSVAIPLDGPPSARVATGTRGP
jgi:signal transduction histidine kinase